MAGYNLPPGCIWPSDIDYYESMNSDDDHLCHHGEMNDGNCAECQEEEWMEFQERFAPEQEIVLAQELGY